MGIHVLVELAVMVAAIFLAKPWRTRTPWLPSGTAYIHNHKMTAMSSDKQ